MQPTHTLTRLTVIGKLIIASSFFLSLAVQAQQCGQTAPLINERLSYMKDVAGYKAENHLPIEDRIQEEKVINSAMAQAESLGLNGESINRLWWHKSMPQKLSSTVTARTGCHSQNRVGNPNR